MKLQRRSLGSLLIFCFLMMGIAAGAPPDSAPNVLFIAVDDLRPELGTYGTKVLTPNLDRFAKSGVQFNRAYCQQAVCGASRLSIMGGLYPTRTGEQSFHVEGWRQRWPDLLTLNQHFGNCGYHTMGLVKIYHGSSGPQVDANHWTEWMSVGGASYLLPENEAAMRAYRRASRAKDPNARRGSLTEMADDPNDAYADGSRTIKAVEILQQQAELQSSEDGEAKPFFLAVGLTKPHLPFCAPKKYWDLYERSDFKMPDNLGIPPGYPKAAAKPEAGEMKKYADYEGEMPTDFSDALNQRLLHGYAACVSYMDSNVGAILEALEKNGLADNTIVVFWGDHGWKLGDHSSWCKHTNFECDTRVPLMVRVPGQLKGHQSTALVELIDLYPTLCELTSLEVPSHCQGKSFASLLTDENATHRESAYSCYPARNQSMGHSIRFGDYRYTEWRKKSDGTQTCRGVLTNLKDDPGEVTNVAKDAAHNESRKRGEALIESRIRHAAS